MVDNLQQISANVPPNFHDRPFMVHCVPRLGHVRPFIFHIQPLTLVDELQMMLMQQHSVRCGEDDCTV
jgi:hypothetical protein